VCQREWWGEGDCDEDSNYNLTHFKYNRPMHTYNFVCFPFIIAFFFKTKAITLIVAFLLCLFEILQNLVWLDWFVYYR